MKRVLAVTAIALSLAACKPKDDAPAPTPPGPSAAASDANAAPDTANQNQADSAASPAAPVSPQAPQLAMAYRLGLVLGADQVRPLMESHQEACERAGPDQCQVLGAQARSEGKDRASAELTLRATPAWMRMFRDRAEADAKDDGGRVADAKTEGEDLGGTIVDSEAAQQARAAERQRLTELMQHKTKDLSETLQIEQEITRVQGEMDQSASELAAMKDRVVMQTLTVTYESDAMVRPDGVTAPLAVASRTFMGHVFAVLAVLLTLASYLAPVALVAAPIVWWVNRKKAKPATAAPAQPPAA